VTVGNVKGATSAYQGSGLETSVGQKASAGQRASYEPQAVAAYSAAGEKRTETNTIGKEPSREWEIKESQRNDAVKRAVEEINKKAKNSEAIFGVHDETNRVTIKIVDKETKEVLKEFPPEQTLDMIAKVWEMAGLLVDERR